MNINHARRTVFELFLPKPQPRDTAPASRTASVTKPNASPATTVLCSKRAEYRVVDGPNGIADLELRVNDMLDQGWKLIGGLCFEKGCAYQAMARVTTEPLQPTGPHATRKSQPL